MRGEGEGGESEGWRVRGGRGRVERERRMEGGGLRGIATQEIPF